MTVVSVLYGKYFAHNKPLRHPAQHLLWAIIALIVLYFGFEFSFTIAGILVLFSFTYLPDLDGLTALFLARKKHDFAREMLHSLSRFQFLVALTLGAEHHKKLNRLVIHNVVALLAFVVLFSFSLASNNNLVALALGTVLIHLTFDIIDDIYHLGHINNWLWPIMWIKNR